jgi:hypothetical protein
MMLVIISVKYQFYEVLFYIQRIVELICFMILNRSKYLTNLFLFPTIC